MVRGIAPGASWLLLILCAPYSAAARTRCKTDLVGDYAYEACGAFCKPEKKQNHCKFCKCRACQFCAGTPPPEPLAPKALPKPVATDDQSAAPAEVPKLPAPRKKKKRTRQMDTAAAPSPAELPQPAAKSATKSVAKAKTKCSSGIKGDYQFETCGGFCKEAKSTNHCKFCKCRTCSFCSAPAAGGQSSSAESSATPRIAPPVDAPPSEAVSPAASSAEGADADGGGETKHHAGSASTKSSHTYGLPRRKPGRIDESRPFLVLGIASGAAGLLLVCYLVAAFQDPDMRRRVFGCCLGRQRTEERVALVDGDDETFESNWEYRTTKASRQVTLHPMQRSPTR